MAKPFHVSLKITIATAFAIAVIATSVLIGITSYVAARDALREGIRLRLKDITTLAAPGVDAAMVAKLRTREDEALPEYEKVKAYLEKVRLTSPDIRFVYLYRIDAAGTVTFVADNEPEDSADLSDLGDVYDELTELGRQQYHRHARAETEKDLTQDHWGTYLSAYVPILNAEGQVECALGIDMSAEAVRKYEERYLQMLLAFIIVTTSAVLLGSLWCSRRISQPLLKLADDMERVQRLELDHESGVRSIVREVVLMRDAVTKLKSSLRSFRKYVPADLVTDLMTLGQEARLSAEKREVTIFFSDIINFSTISEQLPPEELVEEMADYFAGMTRSIIDHDGTVDKYIGDAIMAFWGAPRTMEDHAVHACLAAMKCRDYSVAIGEKQQREGKMPMFTRIGIHTGVAIIGNIGFEARLNYTAMGDMVNLGSRLEGLNKYYGTQILISEATRRAAGHAIETRFIDLVAVKGKTVPVRVYELICQRGELAPAEATLVAAYEQGMELYLARQFGAAIEVFENLARSHPADRATSVMLKRCVSFLKAPPRAEWQGEFVMDSK